jgi:hypothetical protein
MTQIITESTTSEDLVVEEEPEKEVLRHIVNPPNNLHIWSPGISAQDIVDIARVRGIEIVALCGAVFVPTRNPEDVKETCNSCLDIASEIMSNI